MLARLEAERREATGRVLAGQEAERLRIAQELHDQVGQELTAVLLGLARVQARLEPPLREDVTDVQEAVRSSLEDVRRIALELRPEALDDLGLISALAVLCERFAQRSGLDVSQRIDERLPALDPDAELVIYRVAQEALTNVARHSGAARARLSLEHDDGDGLVMTVTDDGRGMPAGAQPGTGIRGMLERAALIGARLELTPGPDGRGSMVALRGRPRGRSRGMTPLKTRILLADDHALVRRGCGWCSTPSPTWRSWPRPATAPRRSSWRSGIEVDLAILDISMPRMTGLQAVAELRRRKPQLRTLILSMHENERYLYEALKAGASGYVLKSVADRDLVEACRAAMRGEAFLYPGAETSLIRDFLRQARNQDTVREDPLTPREQEVVKLIAESYSTRQIADALVISEKTVDRHRTNILEKLGMHDRVELTRYAIRRGLVEP